jgi:hypothetical protein
MNLLDMNGTGAVAACCGTMRPIRSFDSECYEGVSAGVAVHGVESLGGDIRRDDPVHGLGDAILGGEVALEGAGALWLKPEFRDELLEVPLAPVHHEGLPIPAHVEGIVHAVYERHDGLILAPDLRIGTDDSANLKDENGCLGIAKGVPIVFRDECRRNNNIHATMAQD